MNTEMSASNHIQIHTEEIMEEIRKEIQEKGYTENDLKLFREVDLKTDIAQQDCYDVDNFENHVANLNTMYYISVEHERSGNAIKRILQKIIGKLIRFYVEPIVEEQLRYNIEVTHTMNQVRLYHVQSQQDIDELNESQRAATYDMTKKIQALEQELEDMKSRMKDKEDNDIGRQ